MFHLSLAIVENTGFEGPEGNRIVFCRLWIKSGTGAEELGSYRNRISGQYKGTYGLGTKNSIFIFLNPWFRVQQEA